MMAADPEVSATQNGMATFEDLLQKLRAEHEELRLENALLRSQLTAGIGDDGNAKPGNATDDMTPLTEADVVMVDLDAAGYVGEAKENSRPDVEEVDEDGTTSASVHVDYELVQVQSATVGTRLRGKTYDLKPAWVQELGADAAVIDQNVNEITKKLRQIERFSTISNRGQQSDVLPAAAKYMMHPMSTRRLAWDLAGLVLIGFDLFAIPLQAFEPPESSFTVVTGWITLVFWTIDMAASCCTSYYVNGKEIVDPKLILKRYAKTWFLLDCVVVIPDWVMTAMGSSNSATEVSKVIRTIRAVRVLRLVRLLKLKAIFDHIYDKIDSENAFIIINLVQLLVAILTLSHLVACCWYFIGKQSQGHFDKNWLRDVGKTPVEGETLAWKYFTSLHWSITQFTPASMDIYATNLPERMFSVAILFWALVALSSVIGSVTNSMTALRNMHGDEMRNLWMLRRYLKQKHIGKRIAARVVKHVEHKIEVSRNVVPESKVVLLKNVSEQLALELKNEVNEPILLRSPLFHQLAQELPRVTRDICDVAIKQTSYAREDFPFDAGVSAKFMYFVQSGEFLYQRVSMHGQFHGDTVVVERSSYPGWMSEPILWTSWYHLGFATCVVPGDLTQIKPDQFGMIVRTHRGCWESAQKYAIEFVDVLNNLDLDSRSDVPGAIAGPRFTVGSSVFSSAHSHAG